MFTSAWLLSSPHSPQDRLVCLPHLCLPPCLLTLSPDMFASAWLLSSPCSPQDRLVCLSHLCPPPCLLTLSPDMFASAWLLSSPRSPQDHLVCLVPSLPATLFAHPFPRHVCQCLAPIKSLLTSRSLGLFLPICSRHLVFSPLPHRVLQHGWLAGGSIHGWFGCSLNVSHQ